MLTLCVSLFCHDLRRFSATRERPRTVKEEIGKVFAHSMLQLQSISTLALQQCVNLFCSLEETG